MAKSAPKGVLKAVLEEVLEVARKWVHEDKAKMLFIWRTIQMTVSDTSPHEQSHLRLFSTETAISAANARQEHDATQKVLQNKWILAKWTHQGDLLGIIDWVATYSKE